MSVALPVRIRRKRLSHLTKIEKKALGDLTFGNVGSMRYYLNLLKEDCRTYHAFIARYKSRVVAWASVQQGKMYIFVDPTYRRQGIGRALTMKAQKWAAKQKIEAKVCPWDLNSSMFFKSVGMTDNISPTYQYNYDSYTKQQQSSLPQ